AGVPGDPTATIARTASDATRSRNGASDKNWQEAKLRRNLRIGTLSSRTPAKAGPIPVQLERCDQAVLAGVVSLTVVFPLPLTEVELKLPCASGGSPSQAPFEKLTVPLYPFCPVMVSKLQFVTLEQEFRQKESARCCHPALPAFYPPPGKSPNLRYCNTAQ